MIEFKGITKKFGSVNANKDVSFQIQKASIHALVGENGAGKSTICNILFGLYKADSGEIKINGKKVSFSSPIEAKAAGLGMVHQHFMLAGPITALDHVVIEKNQQQSFWKNLFAKVDRKKILDELNQLSLKFNMIVPWEKKIEELSVGIHQRIEILKLLYNHSEILILDEPTAVLTPQETEGFFEQLRELRKAGKTIIIITHKLKEVKALADTVTVMKAGQTVGTYPVREMTVEKLGALMVGSELQIVQVERQREATGLVRLSLRDYSIRIGEKEVLKKLNLELRPHEIVGIAGVEGNGQTELINSIVRPWAYRGYRWGNLDFKEESLLLLSSRGVRNMGIAFFPEDRLHQAVLPEGSALENFLLGQQYNEEFNRFGFIQWKKLRQHLDVVMQKFDVRPQNMNLPLEKFSGGNQQKLVVGREMSTDPELLIAAHPTRGVDIGAMQIIHREMIDLRNKGGSILLISSDLDELFKLSDRIFVLFEGQFVAQFFHYEFDEKKIGAKMGGGQE
jgi:simple sugar transport system ATP-binding protein